MNCLGINHFVRECKSNHKCKQCQRPHHTLLHEDSPKNTPSAPPDDSPSNPVTSHTAVNAGLKLGLLLMTFQILVVSPNGSSSEALALLDSALSASFISDHLAQTLNLPHSSQNTYITGIAGLSHKSPTQSITNFVVSPSRSPSPRIQVSGIIVPQVTYLFIQFPLTSSGIIFQIFNWLILILGNLEGSMSNLELISSLM